MAEIGFSLREARMRARIDISEVEARTKIRAKYLRALENEEWDLLPGPVYVKSFLKTYGDFLGLDSRLLVDEFKRRYERPTDHEARAVASTSRERERHRQRQQSRFASLLFSPRSVIGLALVVIVAALYVIGSHSGNSNSGDGHVIRPPTSTVGDGGHHGTGTGTSPGHASTTTTNAVTAPPPPAKATLALVATGTVWVCVENQDGRILVPGVTYTDGEKMPEHTGRQLLVTLGNSHVNMTVNGKSYTPAASAAAIGLRITPHGTAPLTSSPTCQ